MKQFKKILAFELRSFMTNKAFVGITLVLVLLITGVMFFPRVADLFSAGSSEDGSSVSDASRPVMLVKSDIPSSEETVKQVFISAFPDYTVHYTDETTDSVKEKIGSGDVECAFVLKDATSFTYYVNNLTMFDANFAQAEAALRRLYQLNAMMAGGLAPEQAVGVMDVAVNGETECLGKDQMQNFFYTYIMIFALYIVIILYGQMVATNVASEKSSRAMELLISSAKPASMMFGKVIASCIAGLVQLAAIFGSALLFYNINKPYWGENAFIDSFFDIPVELLIYMLVFFLLGFLVYAFLYGAAASTVSKLEDVNTVVTPITFLFVAGFMVVVFPMTSGNVDNVLMKICSFIPFTSPMAMFTRIAMSTVPVYEIVISIVILVLSAVGIGILSAKIYRAGVLLYGGKPKLGEVVKTVFKA